MNVPINPRIVLSWINTYSILFGKKGRKPPLEDTSRIYGEALRMVSLQVYHEECVQYKWLVFSKDK